MQGLGAFLWCVLVLISTAVSFMVQTNVIRDTFRAAKLLPYHIT